MGRFVRKFFRKGARGGKVITALMAVLLAASFVTTPPAHASEEDIYLKMLEGQSLNITIPLLNALFDAPFDPYIPTGMTAHYVADALEDSEYPYDVGVIFHAKGPTEESIPVTLEIATSGSTVTKAVYVDILQNHPVKLKDGVDPVIFVDMWYDSTFAVFTSPFLSYDWFEDEDLNVYWGNLFPHPDSHVLLEIDDIEEMKYFFDFPDVIHDYEDLASLKELRFHALGDTPPGEYEGTITAVDIAGNEATVTLKIIIPELPPNRPPVAMYSAVEFGLEVFDNDSQLWVDYDLMYEIFMDPDDNLSHLEIEHGHGDAVQLCENDVCQPLIGPAYAYHKVKFAEPGVYDLAITAVDQEGLRSEKVQVRVSLAEHFSIWDYSAPYSFVYQPLLPSWDFGQSSEHQLMMAFYRADSEIYVVPYQATPLTVDELEQMVNDGIGYSLDVEDSEEFAKFCNAFDLQAQEPVLMDCKNTAYEGLGNRISFYGVHDGEVYFVRHYMLTDDELVTIGDVFAYLEQPMHPVEDEFYLKLMLSHLTPVSSREPAP